jgi:glutamyl/glutaminyl-tRNA synthetase
MSSPVRVRFAPSPTGFLHVGGARTALFNWLYARHTGGQLVLRIEDTDRARNTVDAVQVIYDGLRWLGLDWDEGPGKGGEHGPYFQSERNAIYERYLAKLEAAGAVYTDPQGAVRFRLPRKPVVMEDLVCGHIEVDRSKPINPLGDLEPDMTVRRADGSWIFHFVNVADDIEMEITHVIRGEDHLSNTPKHLELYAALGAHPPRFAHIPLILNRDGSKMSKRDTGASVQGYIELEKINRRNAAFDPDKCFWLNGQYIASMPLERFRELSLPFLRAAGLPVDGAANDYLDQVLVSVKEKVKLLKDVPPWTAYFFSDDFPFDQEAFDKTLRAPGAAERLLQLADRLAALAADQWGPDGIEAAFKELAAMHGVKTAAFIHPARVAVSGRSVGPSLYHMLVILGREKVVARLRAAADAIKGA